MTDYDELSAWAENDMTLRTNSSSALRNEAAAQKGKNVLMNINDINTIKAEKYDAIKELFQEHRGRLFAAMWNFSIDSQSFETGEFGITEEPVWEDYEDWARDCYTDWTTLFELLND